MTFTRVPTVAPGDPITSREAIGLARGINDRILSGIADGAYRITQGEFNLWRQVRNPADGLGLVFPAQGEWFEAYSHVEPEHGYRWPLAGAGEAEGANLGNPFMQFRYGSPGLHSEEDRLNEGVDAEGNALGVPLWLGFGPPQTAAEFWELGKYQRGAIDPVTFEQFVPAMEAAQSFFKIATPYWSPMGKSYGGYFPTPEELLATCDSDSEADAYGIPSWEIKFTGQRTDVESAGYHGTLTFDGDGRPVITYAGSCPAGSEFGGVGHVLAKARMPFATYVAVDDGAGGYDVDRFAHTDWVEGPYEGTGTLAREDGEQVQRAVWAFGVDFRGTPSQRDPDTFEIEQIAFDFQAFAQQQYLLAPARAQFSGGQLEAIYPTASLTRDTQLTHGNEFLFTTGLTSHQFATGFVLPMIFVRCDQVIGEAVVLEIIDGETVVQRVAVAVEAGSAETILQLSTIVAPLLKIRTAEVVQFMTGSGSVVVEAAELLDYKPNFWDWYLVLRLSATKGGFAEASGVDGRGRDTANALALWENYYRWGCIVNFAAAGVRSQAEAVNDNPVYDAAMRVSRNHVRILNRKQFLSYEVSGGKTILRFLRHVDIAGAPSNLFDCFEGIAPPALPIANGKLIAGQTYIVRGDGSVTYMGGTFGAGQTFTATEDKWFQTHGEAEVFEKDGIRQIALPQGWSNRWVMFLQTKCYHPSESSIWKADAYGDYFTWNQRCHFYSGSMENNRFNRHVNFNHSVSVDAREDGTGYSSSLLPMRVQANYIAPEAPSGYNFAHNANNSGGSTQFRTSCQIYQAPYEVESATVEWDGLGREVVKLTFKGRFQHHEDAPGSVDSDPGTWVEADLTDEDYRTDENALREYALHRDGVAYQCSFKTGDSGTNSGIEFVPDNPFGSCYPHFFFVRLVPEPYEDENTNLEQTDTRATIDMLLQAETYLRFMCEGFIDGQTSLDVTCRTSTGSLFDYRYSALCFEAFSGNSVGSFSLVDRPDNPPGYGPQPNTLTYAEVFNRLALATNLLDKARVMIPFTLECRSDNYIGEKSVDSMWGDTACSLGTWKMAYSGSPAPAGTLNGAHGDWAECSGTGSYAAAGIVGDACDGTQWVLQTSKNIAEYRVKVEATWLEAIPATWRDMLSTLGGVIGTRETYKCRANATNESDQNLSAGCCQDFQQPCPGFFWVDGEGWKDIRCDQIELVNECVLLTGGVLDAGTPPGGLWVVGRAGGGIPPCVIASESHIAVNVFTDPGFFVQIPLIAMP